MTKIKKCTLSDLNTLEEISRSTFFETFGELNSPENMNEFLEKAYNPEKLKRELEDNNQSFYFLFFKNELAGYIKLNEAPSQTDLNEPNGLEIERLYIRKSFLRKGLGSELMNFAVRLAAETKKKFVWLGVWEHNIRAIKFYETHGYYRIGKHSFFLGNDEQTDFVLRKDI